jgi:hypothetical protein
MARCNDTRKDGQPCGSHAVTRDGKCAMHGGLSDPKKMRAKRTNPAGHLNDISTSVIPADDKIRDKARKVLNKMLESDNPQVALRAAQSLAAYSPEKPINEQQLKGWDTKHSGLPMKELLDSLKLVAGDETFVVLPSPGEVLAPRTDDQTSPVPSISGS